MGDSMREQEELYRKAKIKAINEIHGVLTEHIDEIVGDHAFDENKEALRLLFGDKACVLMTVAHLMSSAIVAMDMVDCDDDIPF